MQLFILAILSPVLVIRLLRWVAIFQQKEYRVDRLYAYLKTQEGKSELFSWLKVTPSMLKKKNIKRPVKTAKAVVLFGLVNLFTIYLIIGFSLWGFIFAYIFAPLVVAIANIPLWIATEFIKYWLISRAKRKIKKYPDMKIIGITGSYGKTSTRKLIAAILKAKYQVWTPPESHNTPLAIARDIVNSFQGADWMIIEFAAYKPGEISKLTTWIAPDIGVLTGLTHQHLSIFGNFDNLINAKSELFEALPKNSKMFVNSDDSNTKLLYDNFSERLDIVKVSSLENKLNKYGNLMLKDHGKYRQTNLVGSHYAINASLAVMIAEHLKLSTKEIYDVLGNWTPESNFIVKHELPNGVILIDDGNTSNPVGFRAAINLSRNVLAKNKILITSGIIDLGNKSREIHKQLAKSASKVFDQIVYLGNTELDIWQKVAASKLIPKDQIESILTASQRNSLILIEGKLPPEIRKFINKFKNLS